MRTRSQKGVIDNSSIIVHKKKKVTFNHEQYVIIFDKLQASNQINKKVFETEPFPPLVKCSTPPPTPPVKKLPLSPKKSSKKKSPTKKKDS